MKEGNNIDKFFKKRLDSPVVEESDWNIPSDHIWDAAKVNFPKEKKRRPFIFWCLGLGIVALAFVLWNSFSSNTISTSTSISTSKTTSTSNSNSSLKADGNENHGLSDTESSTATSKNNLKASVAELKAANKTNSISINKAEAQSQSETQQPSSLTIFDKNTRATKSVNSNPLIDSPTSDIKNKLKVNVSKSGRTKVPAQFPTPNDRPKRENSGSPATEKTEVPLIPIDDTKTNKKEENNITTKEGLDNIEKTNKLIHSDKNVNNTAGIANEGLSTLPGLTMAQLSRNIKGLALPEIRLLEVIKKRPIHKWEVGISHAPFILNPFKVAASELERESEGKSDSDVGLSSTYLNVNLHLRRRLGTRFSLSSGLSFSTIDDINLNFDLRDAYASDLKDQVNRHASIGSLRINDAQADFDISFIPSANVMDGDTLQIIGEIDAEVNAFQLPLLLNYHIRRGKFDWMFHAGTTIDILSAHIHDVKLELFKEGTLASEPFVFTRSTDTDIGLSVIAGAGVKYHIGDHFNMGLSVKFDLGGIISSRYDIGLFYGF